MRNIGKKSLDPQYVQVTMLFLRWLPGAQGTWDLLDEDPSLHTLELLFQGGRAQFVIAFRSQATSAILLSATASVRDAAHSLTSVYPLVVVPFMGEAGAQICAHAGVHWLDLSGNAAIHLPGLHVHVQGCENQFKRQGRPSSVFAPRSSRLIRQLLMQDGPISQRELVAASELDPGFASRVLRTMTDDGMLKREGDLLSLNNKLAVLDAWRAEYDFDEHAVVKGHLSVRDGGSETLGELLVRLHAEGDQHAVTGLAAAAMQTQFGEFRLVSVYVRELPDPDRLRALGIRSESRGANVWLIQPKDDAVFWSVPKVTTHALKVIPVVHPLQVYLDLKAQPERSAEASASVRSALEKRWGEA